MSPERTDASRRRLLKSIGATGLALGAVGTATATGTDDAPASTDDEVSPDGYWEYDCTQIQCEQDGSGRCQRLKRYCNAGGCSGWEPAGCCYC